VFGRRLSHVCGAASSKPIGGLPRDLLIALIGNADVRRQLLACRVPLASEGILHDRCLSTDDQVIRFGLILQVLENEWSCLVLLLSFKPTIRMAAAMMATVDWLGRMRRDPELGIHVIHVTMTAQGSYSRSTNRPNRPQL
jgi:hypothetical protein